MLLHGSRHPFSMNINMRNLLFHRISNVNLRISLLILLMNSEIESKSINGSDPASECFSQSKVYHADTGKCFKLLTRGPCGPGFWLVLDRAKATPKSDAEPLEIRAVCVQDMCPENGFYWSKTNTCVQSKDKKHLCGDSLNEELLNNYFGEAECRCTRDPLRARFQGNEQSPCHQLYTQGPCRAGEVIAYLNGDHDNATCLVDRCYKETLRMKKEGTLSKYGVLAPWINGSCYELGTQGPCAKTLKFKVDERTRQPHCMTLTNAIFDIDKPNNCYRDENGDCQKKINRVQNAEKYKEELLAALSSAKKKRSLKNLRHGM